MAFTQIEIERSFGDSILGLAKVVWPKTYWAPSSPVHYELERGLLDKGIIKSNYILPRGLAKGQPLWERVLTPTGWSTIEQLNVGDFVVGSNGKPTRITHLSPITSMDIYKVKTRDGRVAHCDEDHLWRVRLIDGYEQTFPLKHLLKYYKSQPRVDKRTGRNLQDYRYFLPTCKPVEFTKKKLTIDPYLLGVIIGDGNIDKKTGYARVHTADEWVIEEIHRILQKKTKVVYAKTSIRVSINGVGSRVKEYGLNVNAYDKFIPNDYLFSSIEDRIAILQGLMDTDGTTMGKNHSFSTVSEKLAENVLELVRSLGGTGTLAFNQWAGNKSYRVTFRVIGVNPFRLPRKADKVSDSMKTYSAITDIEKVGVDKRRCIKVEAEDGLYITNDYMLTHNTTIVAEAFPLHHKFVENMMRPSVVVIVSKTQAHSKNRISSIQNVLEYSPHFKTVFGYWGQHTAEKWRDDEIVLKDGSAFVARGMGQPLRGLNYYGNRPTLIVLDDPEDENNTKTAEAMEANLNWLLQACVPALDTRGGRVAVIGTPLHQRCMVETLKDAPDWHSVTKSYIETDSEGQQVSIWPEVKTVEELVLEKEALSKIGRVHVWYKERMCQVIGDETQTFRKEDFRYWDGELVLEGGYAWLAISKISKNKDEMELHESKKFVPVNLFMGVDPASSQSSTADFSAIFLLAVDADDNLYQVDTFRKRVQPTDFADTILNKVEWLNKGKALQKFRVEATGYQEMLRNYIIKESRKKNLRMAGVEIKELPHQKKEIRLKGLQPHFNNHKFFMKLSDENTQALEDELMLFPLAKHDDLVDSLWYAQKLYYPPTHTHLPNNQKEATMRAPKRSGSNSEQDWLLA